MTFETEAAEQSSYIKLGKRMQRAVNSPRGRVAQNIILERQPDESTEDWERMLEPGRDVSMSLPPSAAHAPFSPRPRHARGTQWHDGCRASVAPALARAANGSPSTWRDSTTA
ncbi:hypothetical protein GCM10027040_27850 [Halomonas shantousis]